MESEDIIIYEAIAEQPIVYEDPATDIPMENIVSHNDDNSSSMATENSVSQGDIGYDQLFSYSVGVGKKYTGVTTDGRSHCKTIPIIVITAAVIILILGATC